MEKRSKDMKKIIILGVIGIIFIVFLFLPSILFAYENEYFKVDIDDTYNEVSINNTPYIR